MALDHFRISYIEYMYVGGSFKAGLISLIEELLMDLFSVYIWVAAKYVERLVTTQYDPCISGGEDTEESFKK